MVSKLAQVEVQKMWKDGLRPSFEDIIKLNALGIALEHNQESSSFGAVPRVAFLGDFLLRQPTVFKQMWIDETRQLLADDLKTQLYFMAYALYTLDDEIKAFKSVKEITNALRKFVDDVLKGFTDTQIFAAVDYCLNGNDPNANEYFTPQQKEEAKKVLDVPQEIKSTAKALLENLMVCGVSGDVKYEVTVPELERMVVAALIHDGVDLYKSQHADNIGRFYACLGSIRTRLEKMNNEKNEEV